jgi:rhamnogalacturonan endolyase
MTDMNPDIEGQEVWQCHESPSKYGAYGLEFRDAKTGKSLWAVDGENKDVGRCMAADIDPRHKGYELWGSVGGLYNVKGEKISDSRPGSMNFGIWWDADLSRELLDGNHIDKWDYQNNKLNRIFTATECTSNNGTKATPCLSGDILGDWREEVILRTTDNKALRIFITTIPAENKLFTLMHDTQYRVAIAWQNSAYNQPPHPSFYLGTDMKTPKQPNIESVASVSVLQNEEDKNEETLVFPNPTNHSFFVKLAGKFSIQIADLQGNIIEKESCQNTCEIGEKLPSGTFMVSIFKQNKKVQSYKILKNN